MGTIDGEDQELRLSLGVVTEVADVDPRQRGHAVPRLAERVVECLQPRFVDREPAHTVQGDPALLPFAHPEEVAEQGGAQHANGQGRQPVGQPLEEGAPPGTVSTALIFNFGVRHGSLLQEASSATRSVTSWSVSGTKSGVSGRVSA